MQQAATLRTSDRACKGNGVKMKKNLFLTLGLSLFVFSATAATNEASFTPDSIIKPILEIGLANTSTMAKSALYTCTGSTLDACNVDITNEAALNALFTGATVAPGTYDVMYVKHCTVEGGYNAQLRGSVSIGAIPTTYYTSSGANPLTTLAASLDYVTVPYQGCETTYHLASPLTVSSGDTVNLSLFFSHLNIAWARLGSKTIPSGCKENAAQTQSVCMAYPDIVPYVGTSTPSLERYYVIENSVADPSFEKVGEMVLLVADSVTGNVLAGFTRRLFSESSVPPSTNFDTPLKQITNNHDGTWYLESYGSTATDTGYVRFPHFRRGIHSSSYLTPAGTSIAYLAYRDIQSELAPCPSGPLFTSYPITVDTSSTPSMTEFSSITPLGNLNPSAHVFPTDHIYFYLNQIGGVPQTGHVYLPGNAYVTAMNQKTYSAGPLTGTVEYKVELGACREFSFYFDHLESLSPALQSIWDSSGPASSCETHTAGPSTITSCSVTTKSYLAAGSYMGTAGNPAGIYAFDLGAHDSRVTPIVFANDARYGSAPNGQDRMHTVCPIDYFETSMRDTLRNFLKAFDGTPRTAAPVCGSIDQDLTGTVQGNWFNTPTPGSFQEDPQLALVHDNIDPTIPFFSVGTTLSGLSSHAYRFTPSSATTSHINRDFGDVTDTSLYCYDNLADGSSPVTDKVILLQRTNPSTLTIEVRMAASCTDLGMPATWSFTSPQTYYR